MDTNLKLIGRLIAGAIAGGVTYYFWETTRPSDPAYYAIGAALVVGIMAFLIIHFVGKE